MLSGKKKKEYREIKRQRTICLIKQRVLGAATVALGVAVPFIADWDATASLIIVPLGLYMVFTRKVVIYDGSAEYLSKLTNKPERR